MSNFTPSLTPDLRRRLAASGRRLVRLLDLGAPDVVVAAELGLLHRKALAGLGPVLWEALYRPDYFRARAARGLCARCDEPSVTDPGGGEPLCAGHRAARDRFEREADSAGPDRPPPRENV